jgi:hypothetical protein
MKPADFVGAWKNQGFLMYVSERIPQDGSKVEFRGTIDDCIGEATFTGTLSPESVSFRKIYQGSEEAGQSWVEYAGERARDGRYRGRYRVMQEDVQTGKGSFWLAETGQIAAMNDRTRLRPEEVLLFNGPGVLNGLLGCIKVTDQGLHIKRWGIWDFLPFQGINGLAHVYYSQVYNDEYFFCALGRIVGSQKLWGGSSSAWPTVMRRAFFNAREEQRIEPAKQRPPGVDEDRIWEMIRGDCKEEEDGLMTLNVKGFNKILGLLGESSYQARIGGSSSLFGGKFRSPAFAFDDWIIAVSNQPHPVTVVFKPEVSIWDLFLYYSVSVHTSETSSASDSRAGGTSSSTSKSLDFRKSWLRLRTAEGWQYVPNISKKAKRLVWLLP